MVLAGAALTQQGDDAPPVAPEPTDLALVETGGGLSAQWAYGGQLDVSLPLLIRNDGDPITITSVALEGTSLAQPAVDVLLQSGGQLPLTLRQATACRDGERVPTDAALRLEVRRADRAETRVLALSDGVVLTLAAALAAQCEAVPLEQALVLRVEGEQVLPDSVEIRARAENISGAGIQLLSVVPARGLQVTATPTQDTDPATPATDLPLVLGLDPLALLLSVAVEDCDVVATVDLTRPVAIADVVYDDGRGNREVKAVVGEFPGLRDQVEAACQPST